MDQMRTVRMGRVHERAAVDGAADVAMACMWLGTTMFRGEQYGGWRSWWRTGRLFRSHVVCNALTYLQSGKTEQPGRVFAFA
jgi:hypothetical protein